MGHRASEGSKKIAYLKEEGRNSIHRVEENDQERHVLFDMGTCHVCVLENAEGIRMM